MYEPVERIGNELEIRSAEIINTDQTRVTERFHRLRKVCIAETSEQTDRQQHRSRADSTGESG